MKFAILGWALAVVLSGAALAEAGPIKTKQEFMQTVVGKDLTILGIRVNVSPDGAIGGRAYGRQIRGSWQWQGGYFCRDLYWGKTDLGPNCQEVRLHGNKVRFTSDRGTGQYADLTIR